MMRHFKLMFAACACFALLSCAAKPRGGSPVAAKGAATLPEYPIILRLVSRAETITVRAGPTAPLYSAHAPDGSAIVVNPWNGRCSPGFCPAFPFLLAFRVEHLALNRKEQGQRNPPSLAQAQRRSWFVRPMMVPRRGTDSSRMCSDSGSISLIVVM